ncbi:MAG: nucleotidyltransferase domain-containing protein, partial [Pseudomonadota bacterium]
MIPANTDLLQRELDDIFVECGMHWAEARPKVLARLKEARASSLIACEETLKQTRSGVMAARRLAEGQDIIIQALFRFTADQLFPTAKTSSGGQLSVVATGGYGRGLLAPGSDIDLLFLFPYRSTPWSESVVETMLYMLWDMRLKVGHAARSVDECIKLARSDVTISTAILECRHIDGEESLSDHLRERFDQAVVRGTGKKFIAIDVAALQDGCRNGDIAAGQLDA